MHFRLLLGLFLLSSAAYSEDQLCASGENYQNHVDLVEGGGFRFYWNVTKNDQKNATDLIGEVHCRTLGWVAFGLTPTGRMNGSDIFVAWFQQNGTVNFTDRHILPHNQVLIDNQQDWILLDSKQADGFNVFKFSRPIILSNPEDMSITGGVNKLIFAWSNTTPQPGSDIQYHQTNRGSIQIVFYN